MSYFARIVKSEYVYMKDLNSTLLSLFLKGLDLIEKQNYERWEVVSRVCLTITLNGTISSKESGCYK